MSKKPNDKKPTVEKWEDVARKIEAILTQKPVYVKPGLSKEAERQLTLVHQRDSLLELLSHSVQEAKAERDRECGEMIEGLKEIPVYSDVEGKKQTSSGWILIKKSELLSTLNTKASLKQEEEV